MADIVPTSATVEPEPGGRLEQLLVGYDAAKAKAEEAAAEFAAIKDDIKAELADARPGIESVDVNSPDLATPLRLVYVTSWRVDAKRMKAENPVLYVRYAVQGGSWVLKAVKR